MKLCKICKAVEEAGVCSLCGKRKTLREARPDDEVYLVSCEYLWTQMVEDALKEAGIPFFRQGTLGPGLTASIGELAELFRYYVPLSYREAALAVLPVFADEAMTEEELVAYMEAHGINVEGETL